MTTVVDICNQALVRAEVSALISDLEEDHPEANVARAVYGRNRDTLLAMAAWPFATRRQKLALLPETENRPGWRYAYALPADCLSARDLDPRAPFHLEDEVVITDAEEAELVYTARVEDPRLFHPLFTDALTWLMAADFALGIAKSREREDHARARFELALSRARARAIGQRRNRPGPGY